MQMESYLQGGGMAGRISLLLRSIMEGEGFWKFFSP